MAVRTVVSWADSKVAWMDCQMVVLMAERKELLKEN